MNEHELRATLEREGFSNIFVQEDSAGKHYTPHKHEKITTHIVLDGLITITVFGHPTILGPGKRLDVPANVIHEATAGPNGCKFLTGEK